MKWTPQMSVGLPELDADHQQLIEIINSLERPAGNTEEGLRQALVALGRYVEFHFAREERVMAACGYRGLAEHQQEHRDFAEKIRSYAAAAGSAAAGPTTTNIELVNYLNEWLRHHILIVDMAYRPVVEGDQRAREVARDFRASEVWWSS